MHTMWINELTHTAAFLQGYKNSLPRRKAPSTKNGVSGHGVEGLRNWQIWERTEDHRPCDKDQYGKTKLILTDPKF